jgi:hypothetical protein
MMSNDILNRSKTALDDYATVEREWPKPRMDITQAKENLRVLVPDLVAEVKRLSAAIDRVREAAEDMVARGQGHGAVPTQSDRTRGSAADEILAALDENLT